MKVSFVIPLFNCLGFTRATLDSLRATLPPGLAHEIILVDDGSTDGTREFLRRLTPPFRIMLNERNLGYAASNNRGAAAANGEFLALLNNDLVLTPGWFEPMLGAFKWFRHAGLVGNVQRNARTGELDHTGIVVNEKAKPEHDRTYPRFPRLARRYKSVIAATGACLFVRRAAFARLGGFDEGYRNGCEDLDLCFRAHQAGLRNYVALRSIIHHHISVSPGRKDRDEANSHRFTLRWREALEFHCAHRLCVNYFLENWATPEKFAVGEARLALWFHLCLRRTPPWRLRVAARKATSIEIARWQQILGSLPSESRPPLGTVTAPGRSTKSIP